jgi:hypothetical protein
MFVPHLSVLAHERSKIVGWRSIPVAHTDHVLCGPALPLHALGFYAWRVFAQAAIRPILVSRREYVSIQYLLPLHNDCVLPHGALSFGP